jgi:phospholipase C
MTRLPILLCSVVIAIALTLLSANGCGGGAHSAAPNQHIVIIVQENRTPDNLFQDPVLISRHADIAQAGLNSKGQTIPLSQIELATNYDLNHNHSSFEDMYDGGKMDGADRVPVTCDPGYSNCPPPNLPANPQFTYVNPAEVQPYFQMAEQYTFADRMFQTNQGPSFPAHQFLLAGTSAPTANSNLFAAENVGQGTGGAGCIATPGSVVRLINPAGVEATNQYPCFEHPTLTDELDAKGISWRYYGPTASSIWTAPDAIQHICQPQSQGGTLVCTGSAWNNVIVPPKGSALNVLKDIANNQLPQVSWVVPSGPESDHALLNDGSGPSWVASVVNAIGNSPYWANTTIIVTWDDWGGWYDHVPPPQVLVNCSQWGCGYVYGFRVPLIVISPYAKAQYISHVNYDFGSILKFVEQIFNLPSLGYADAAALGDLSDCFNFSQTPLAFHTIAAPLSQEHFLNDPRPPSDPDDD